MLNARSLAKTDALPALYADVNCNDIDTCCISETWLKLTIPDHLVCPDGYSIMRKDRTNSRGGSVATVWGNDWKMHRMPFSDNSFECLWTEIITQNSNMYVATLYHPPNCGYEENDLIEYLIDTCEQILSVKPNSKIVIAGDITKLNIQDFLNQLSFTQIVKIPSRCQNILVFITNSLYDWKKVKVVKSLVKSDLNQ